MRSALNPSALMTLRRALVFLPNVHHLIFLCHDGDWRRQAPPPGAGRFAWYGSVAAEMLRCDGVLLACSDTGLALASRNCIRVGEPVVIVCGFGISAGDWRALSSSDIRASTRGLSGVRWLARPLDERLSARRRLSRTSVRQLFGRKRLSW